MAANQNNEVKPNYRLWIDNEDGICFSGFSIG